MGHSELAISLGTRDDVPDILDLQERKSEHGETLSVRCV